MLTKDKVISSLNDLPDTFSMDELIDKLMLLQKIETGLEQSEKGEVFSTELIQENAEFIAVQRELADDLGALERGEVPFISLDQLEQDLEATIRKHEA